LKVCAIITAAGSGLRFGEQKQFKLLHGLSLLYHTLKPFLLCKGINEIIIVVPKNKKTLIHKELALIKNEKPITIIVGGQKRQNSVKNGVLASSRETELVCIHDAVRPFVTNKLIEDSIHACAENDGAIVAIPNYDTLKIVQNGFIKKTLSRERTWLAQTPQTFWKSKILDALNHAEKAQFNVTDESSIMEKLGYQIAVVNGDHNNFKITSPIDWQRAERLIK